MILLVFHPTQKLCRQWKSERERTYTTHPAGDYWTLQKIFHLIAHCSLLFMMMSVISLHSRAQHRAYNLKLADMHKCPNVIWKTIFPLDLYSKLESIVEWTRAAECQFHSFHFTKASSSWQSDKNYFFTLVIRYQIFFEGFVFHLWLHFFFGWFCEWQLNTW